MKKTQKKSGKELQKQLERCKRAKMIRNVLGLSRGKIQRKYGIAISTLQYWEDARIGGIVETSADKLVKVFNEEGLNVTAEWILYGIGESPLRDYEKQLEQQYLPALAVTPPTISPLPRSEELTLLQELKLFYQLNLGAVHTVVGDDGLSPWLMPGDYVAGKLYFEDEIARVINLPAIVQTVTGNIMVRVVQRGQKPQHFQLTCTNPHTAVAEPCIPNIKLISAAPISWIRKLGEPEKFEKLKKIGELEKEI